MTAPQPKACPVCGSYAKQSTFEHGDNSVWCSNADCPLCLLVMSESTWSRLLLAPPGMADPMCVEQAELRGLRILAAAHDKCSSREEVETLTAICSAAMLCRNAQRVAEALELDLHFKPLRFQEKKP